MERARPIPAEDINAAILQAAEEMRADPDDGVSPIGLEPEPEGQPPSDDERAVHISALMEDIANEVPTVPPSAPLETDGVVMAKTGGAPIWKKEGETSPSPADKPKPAKAGWLKRIFGGK